MLVNNKQYEKVFIFVIVILLVIPTQQVKPVKKKSKTIKNNLNTKINKLESNLLKLQRRVGNNEEKILDQLLIGYQNIIENWPKREFDSIKDVESLNEVHKPMERIKANFDNATQTFATRKLIQKVNLISLAKESLHGEKNLLKTIRLFHNFINKKLFSKFNQELNQKICQSEKSPQQSFYHLYNNVELTNDKAFLLIRFANIILKIFKDKSCLKRSILKHIQNEHNKFNKKLKSMAKTEMKTFSQELYKCDPKHHVDGISYLEITELLQGYFLNENDLSGNNKCGKNCSDYLYVASAKCQTEKLCSVQRTCNGKIRNCKFIHSKFSMCPAENPHRRFDSVRFKNFFSKDRVFGKEKNCKKDLTTVDKWRKKLIGYKCDYCFCLCDEEYKNSDRYFNLRPTMANITDNMVVTGLRFVKKNRLIHLQIQQGKFLAKGQIDPISVQWVPVEDYQITDDGIKNGKDFHTFTYEQRSIDLDDLKADKDHVVTGIGFEIKHNHLNFKIHTTPLNLTSGELLKSPEKSKWIFNPQSPDERKEIKLINPDIPTLALNENDQLSTNGSYIALRESDMDADASQTTVPFFDAQVIESSAPLSGAGIHHRGQKNQLNFGGFIAPKIFTFDYTNQINN